MSKNFSACPTQTNLICRSLSLFGAQDRVVFLFPGREEMVIEFPTDDPLGTAISYLLKGVRDCGIEKYRSAKRSARLQALPVGGPNITLDPSARDSLINAKGASDHPNVYAFPVTSYHSGIVRTGIQAHPAWSSKSPLTAGRGPLCTVSSGASQGCAFVSRLKVWDGLRFNDPAAFLYFGDSPLLGFQASAEVLLLELAKYTLLNFDKLEEQLIRADKLLGSRADVPTNSLRTIRESVVANLEAITRWDGSAEWLKRLKTA